LAQVAQPILLRAFYALGEVRTPALAGLASVGLNIAFSLILAPALGHGGLALANSLAASFYVLALYISLKGRLPYLETRALLKSCTSIAMAATFMGGTLYILGKVLNLFNPLQATWALGVKISILAGVSLIVFLVLAWAFKVEEMELVQGLVGRRR